MKSNTKNVKFLSSPSRRKMAPLMLSGIFLLSSLLLSSCSSQLTAKEELPKGDTIPIGNSLTVANDFEELTLTDYNTSLAADGLYYAVWSVGDASDYENEEGEIVPLYEAQLYLVAGEFQSEEAAADNKETWLNAAKNNYVNVSSDSVIMDDVVIDRIVYKCKESSPYEHGISAFAARGTTAICAEFTCTEGYTEDLAPMLEDFLKTIVYQ